VSLIKDLHMCRKVCTCRFPILLFTSVVLVMVVSSCGCAALPNLPGSTAAPSTESNSGSSAGSHGSYVQVANPVPEGSPSEVRDLSEKSGEVSSPVMRKSLDDISPVYTGHYTPRYSNSAFQIHVGTGPLIIRYRTVPLQYDPRVSFLKITVRDAKSMKVVAENGYGEPYPSNTVNTITVNGEGDYHINIYGNQVDVIVSAYTGDSM